MKGVVVAMVVHQQGNLLDGIDMEDAARVDHILAAHAHEEPLSHGLLADSGLHLGEAEGNHEMRPRRIINMGVMVVRLKIHDLVQVYHEQLSIHTEA